MAKRTQIFVDEAAGEELVLPVTPPNYQWDTGVNVNVVTVDGLGDLHFPGRKTLATENIECFFPAREYPFNEPDTNLDPFSYVSWIEARCLARTVLRYIVSGTPINKAVILENIRYYEDDGTNDVKARITVREYEPPQTLQVAVETGKAMRSEETAAIAERTHTIASGDTLWALCKKFYGTASIALCERVAAHNGVKNINLIALGTVLKFPALTDLPETRIETPPSQKAINHTTMSKDEAGERAIVFEPTLVEVSLAMAGVEKYYGSAQLFYTKAGSAGGEQVLRATVANQKVSVELPIGSKVTVRWSDGNGKSDYRSINGARNEKSTLKINPVRDTAIVVHWAKR